MKLAAVLSLIVFVACSGAAPVNPPPQPSPPRDLAAEAAEAEALFRNLEDRLLHAKHLEIMARLQSRGAVASELVGHLTIQEGRRVHYNFDGRVGGAPAHVLLIGDGQGMGMNDTGALPSPPALVPALLLGATRMGLLHNVVVTSGDELPEHSESEDALREWVTVDSFSFGREEKLRGRAARAVKFRILIDNQPVGEATLWIATATGLPIQRRQTVHFPNGDMQVTESYGRFAVEP